MGQLIHLLAAQAERVQPGPAHGAAVLGDKCEELSVDEGQQGLVARGPHPVPGPVERVGHGRTQHVVQVDLSGLEDRGRD